jgi:hypothetical protein
MQNVSLGFITRDVIFHRWGSLDIARGIISAVFYSGIIIRYTEAFGLGQPRPAFPGRSGSLRWEHFTLVQPIDFPAGSVLYFLRIPGEQS